MSSAFALSVEQRVAFGLHSPLHTPALQMGVFVAQGA
jgi:hypothetical protein